MDGRKTPPVEEGVASGEASARHPVCALVPEHAVRRFLRFCPRRFALSGVGIAVPSLQQREIHPAAGDFVQIQAAIGTNARDTARMHPGIVALGYAQPGKVACLETVNPLDPTRRPTRETVAVAPYPTCRRPLPVAVIVSGRMPFSTTASPASPTQAASIQCALS